MAGLSAKRPTDILKRDLLVLSEGEFEVVRHDYDGKWSFDLYRKGVKWDDQSINSGNHFLFALVERLFEQQDQNGPETRSIDDLVGQSEKVRLWPNWSRVSGREETFGTRYTTDTDQDLACLAQSGQRAVVEGLTLGDVAKLRSRIDREISRMEEVKDMLIGVKSSVSEVMR